MEQMKSLNLKADGGVVRAMRPLWRIGIPATVALATAVAILFAIALDGCSNSKNNKTNVTASSLSSSLPGGSGSATSSLPAAGSVAASPTLTQKKKPVVQRLSTVGYADSISGVTFRYPRSYTLLTPEKVKLNQSLQEIPMNFVQPGGVSVATIGLPGGPATSLFKVSFNKNLTSEQCKQFAEPAAADLASNSPVDTNDGSIPANVSIRGVEFSQVEAGTEQTDIRYYHHFENGACYEFVLAVEEAPGNTKAVDHFELFDKLERILATVKIKPEIAPAVTAGVPATPASGSNPQ